MNAGAIIESVLDPVTECLTSEAAQRIIGFCIDRDTQTRVNELAAGARSGNLSDEELREYREMVEAFDLVAILKAKARAVLSGSQ